MDIYRLSGPTEWAEPPTRLSFSSLTATERCPRQWQLVHSRYGALDGFPVRPSPAAVEGQIVHAAVERLFRTLACRGLPTIGTPAFERGVADAGLRRWVAELVREHEERIARHPRGNGFRTNSSVQQLTNTVVRLFRPAYLEASRTPGARLPLGAEPTRLGPRPVGRDVVALLAARTAVSEVRLEHPNLPFAGVIDLVWSDGGTVVVSDFKAGQTRPTHREQLVLYAILWWRTVGAAPGRLEIRYPGTVDAFALSAEQLAAEEENLRVRLAKAIGDLRAKPARHSSSDACRYCDVRQFCDPYWESLRTPAPAQRRGGDRATCVDAQVTVTGVPSDTGLEAAWATGKPIPVVFEPDVARLNGPFVAGESLRVLGALVRGNAEGLEFTPRSEVFRRDGD